MLLSSYAAWKIINLINLVDYTVRVYDQENFYDIKEEFGPEDGFMLAAGLTAYDSSPEDITDLSIGRLKFIKKIFSHSSRGIRFEDIETKFCNQTELLEGEETPSSDYFELADMTREHAQTYAPKMLCASNPADLTILGNYDAEEASNVMLVFEKCHSSWST